MSEQVEASFDHNEPAFVLDPHAVYGRLRESDPVHFNGHYGGFWLLTRYEDVRRAAIDWSTFSSATIGMATIPATVSRTFPEIPLEVDPPGHTSYRKLVADWFTRSAMDDLEPSVRRIVTDLLDGLDGRDRFDLVQDFALPTAARSLGAFLGLPTEDADRYVTWVTSILHNRLSDPDTARAMSAKLVSYVDDIVRDRRDRPRDDFFGALATSELDGRPLTDMEIRGYGVLMLLAGQDTTVNGIGGSLWYLAEHPEARRRLIEQPDLIPTAVEELLRYLTPVQLFGRNATKDTELHGRTIHKDEAVALCFAAANRDPSVFEDPEECKIDRAPNRHMAFGAGPHACLGAHVARLEMRVSIEVVLRRMPEYSLESDRIAMTPHGDLRGPWMLPARRS